MLKWSFAEECNVVLFPVLGIHRMVTFDPEILNIELVSLSCLFNVLFYSFDGFGIRIKLFHVFFHFLMLLLGRQ